MEKAGSREAYGPAGDPSEARPAEARSMRAGSAEARRDATAGRVVPPRAPRDDTAVTPVAPAARVAPGVPVEHAARGEHTHSETPIPRPRLTREGVRDTGTQVPGPRSVIASGAGSAFAPAVPRPVIQRASVRGQILDALRSALVSGDLAPGEVYSAPALGDRFGVSATPVREAMQQLANEGAVEVVPNRGFRVIRRGARELAELAEIRGLVEMPVMLRLTRTVGAPCWAELRPLADATVTAAATGDHARYAESDRVFHAAVLALSGNRQLVQLADDLHRRAQWPLAGAPARRTRADLLADAAQHTAILDALTAQDVPAAQSLVREHFAGA
ncbi:GntR family transcriptional regulator [Streptomyces aurantiacus]|uniref:GntR family transcriptional regulator n=2 Tax=Streptomyces aurantiacus TaxID=47760 RepID=A0A7G1NWG1_9ACTN|nr:GntR family transcriptional regulator [Streptomyces aurantiacus]BCL26761.1 GntR family transcriptional regulator [Streptomyces aurantiacus]